jgi:hypothetical protein
MGISRIILVTRGVLVALGQRVYKFISIVVFSAEHRESEAALLVRRAARAQGVFDRNLGSGPSHLEWDASTSSYSWGK